MLCRHGAALSDRRELEVFLDHFGISPVRPDGALLVACGAAFARMPYENLTKLIRKHTVPAGAARRRMPQTVIEEHVTFGAGGTCFALASFFRAVLRGLGFRCDVVVADMRNRPCSHCALVVQLDDGPVLVDPAYLVAEPLPLRAAPSVGPPLAATAQLAADPRGRWAELFTHGKLRYRVRLAPVAEPDFFALWDASFDWTMMNDLHVCAASGDGYAYFHGHTLRCQQREHKQTFNVRGDETRVLRERFGLAPQLVEQARGLLAVVRGEARRR